MHLIGKKFSPTIWPTSKTMEHLSTNSNLIPVRFQTLLKTTDTLLAGTINRNNSGTGPNAWMSLYQDRRTRKGRAVNQNTWPLVVWAAGGFSPAGPIVFHSACAGHPCRVVEQITMKTISLTHLFGRSIFGALFSNSRSKYN